MRTGIVTYLQLLQSKRALAEILDGERDEHGHRVLGGDHQVDHVVGYELVGELVAAAAYEHVDGVARGPSLAAAVKDGPPPPPLLLYDPLYQPGHPLLGLAGKETDSFSSLSAVSVIDR